MSCMQVAGITLGSAAAASFTTPTDLGNTMFVGDSLTHGFNSPSYRWELNKILVDNNITFNEVGIYSGNRAGSNGTKITPNTLYGNKFFRNQHSGYSGGYAHVIAGTTGRSSFQNSGDTAGQYYNANIRQWLGLDPSYTGNALMPAEDRPNTFFLLIGTNDWGQGSNNEQRQQIKQNLLGTIGDDGSYKGDGDIDVIVGAMRDCTPDANIVLLTIPTCVASVRPEASRKSPDYLRAVQEYNAALEEWAKQNGVTLVQSDRGMVDVTKTDTEWTGEAVTDLFAGEGLHPNNQGDLIIAGNVARALGYAGRTAGQLRKSATEFALNFESIRSDGAGWGSAGASISAGQTASYTWASGTDLSHGFTVDFTISGGVGNGAEDGWNTTGNFSISVGDGTNYGTLNINEAYIQWGNSKLYSLDMSTFTDSLRIAYVYGNSTKNLPTGFYIWMDDQLIAEGLAGDTQGEAVDGLIITNGTEGDISLEDLSMDGSGSWAPMTDHIKNGNPLISAGGVFEYGDFSGKEEWIGDDQLYETGVAISNNVRNSLGGKKGGTVNSGSVTNGYANSGDYEGKLYITLSGSSKITGFWGFHTGGTFTGDAYLRFLNHEASEFSSKGFIGTLNAGSGGIDGNLYVELSSDNVTITTQGFDNVNAAISGVYKASLGITQTFRVVINRGTVGNIIGGTIVGDARVGAVEIFLNGGILNGNIAAGGFYGSVGNRSITITGDEMILSPDVKLITAGSATSLFSSSATVLPTATVDGTATVTLADVTLQSNFAQWKGTISGGESCDGRALIFSNTWLPELWATIENFDSLTLEDESIVGLKSLGGAQQVTVTGDSELTLLASETTYETALDNLATVVLAKGAGLIVTGVSEEKAESMKGKYVLEGGSSLTMGAKTDGSYTVEVAEDSSMTLDAGAKGSYKVALETDSQIIVKDSASADLAVSMVKGSSLSVLGANAKGTYELTLNGGGTLNGMDAAGVVGSVAVSDATAAGLASFELSGALKNGKMQLTLAKLSAGSTVSDLGVADVITLAGKNSIELGSAMMERKNAMLKTEGMLKLAQGATLNVGLSGIIADLEEIEAAGSVSYYLTQGDLSQLTSAAGVVLDATFMALDMTVEFTEDGALRFVKNAEDTEDPDPEDPDNPDPDDPDNPDPDNPDNPDPDDPDNPDPDNPDNPDPDDPDNPDPDNPDNPDPDDPDNPDPDNPDNPDPDDPDNPNPDDPTDPNPDDPTDPTPDDPTDPTPDDPTDPTPDDPTDPTPDDPTDPTPDDPTDPTPDDPTDPTPDVPNPPKPAGSGIYNSANSNTNGDWGTTDGENIYDSVGSYGAVVLNSSTTIDLSEVTVPDAWSEDGLTIHNLMGTESGRLAVKGDKTGNSKVTLTNVLSADMIKELEDQMGVKVEKVLTYAGDISITDAELQVKHVNPDAEGQGDADSTTVVKGNLQMQGQGGLTLTSGVLQLEGADNDMGSGDIRFAGHDGQLVVTEGATVTVRGDLLEQEGKELTDAREHVRLEGGVLALEDGAAVRSGLTLGNESAELAGTLSVVSGSVSVAQNSRLAHVLLHVQEGSELVVAAPMLRAAAAEEYDWDVVGMSGGGSVTGAKDISFALAGGDSVYTGSLEQYQGTMSFAASDYWQVFAGVKGGAGWNVTNGEGGRVAFELTGGKSSLEVGTLALASGSHTSLLLDLLNPEGGNLQVQALQVETAAHIHIGQSEGIVTLEGEKGDAVTLATITVLGDDGELASKLSEIDWTLSGIRNAAEVYIEYSAEDKVLYLKTYLGEQTLYAAYADNKNSRAGADMLGAIRNSAQLGGDIARLDSAVYDMLEKGDTKKANEVMAAAAGAGVPAMGLAFSNDVERQLRALRNRASSLPYGEEEGAGVDVWLNAETDYHKQKADGMLAGYKTNGWGGTVGASTHIGKHAAAGLALTAMYNDLTADSADHLKGDMDTFYVSGFAQVAHGAWRHTVIATVGQAQLDVERTVNYGSDSYKTKGSTDGLAFGFMYEGGYSIALNETGDTALQPIFNISFRHSAIDAYSETGGSNAALRVGDQELNSITFGVGARYQTLLDGKLWNRLSVFEARAILKARAGDTAGTASVAFQHEGALVAEVESESTGSVGIELGAGVTVAVGAHDDIFVDISAELWGNYTNANASIGYKMSF